MPYSFTRILLSTTLHKQSVTKHVLWLNQLWTTRLRKSTVDLFYPWDLSRLIRHAWDTVGLFHSGPLVSSHDMPGIEWTYSIPGPLVTSYDMPGIEWTYSISGPLVSSHDMPGIEWTYSIPGPLVSSHDMPGIEWTYSIPGP